MQQEREENKTANDLEKNVKTRWFDFSPIFAQSQYGHNYKVEQLFLLNQIIAKCNYRVKGESAEDKNTYQKGKNKFQGADKIINWLAYLSKHDGKEYLVSYEDRFLGIMEIPI